MPGYPDWCGECGWNLHPPPAPDAPARPARARRPDDRPQVRRPDGAELLGARELEPRWTPAKLAAYTIAVAVHLLMFGLIAGGLAAIVVEFPNALAIVIGVTMAVSAC